MNVHLCSVASSSLQPHGQYRARLFCLWNFPRPEYWSRLQFPTLGDLPYPGIKLSSLASPALQADFFFLPLHHIYIGVFQLSISENSRYISSVFHLLERWEEGRQCWQTAKQLLDYLDGYAVNLLCYFPLVLIVVLNSLKTEKKFLYFTIELTAQLEEKYCWNLSMNVANLCCIYRQEEN